MQGVTGSIPVVSKSKKDTNRCPFYFYNRNRKAVVTSRSGEQTRWSVCSVDLVRCSHRLYHVKLMHFAWADAEKINTISHFCSFPIGCSREARPNYGFFILSFCRSVKESIKESAFGRRQAEILAKIGSFAPCETQFWAPPQTRDIHGVKCRHTSLPQSENECACALLKKVDQNFQ